MFFYKTLIFENNKQWNNTKFKIRAKKILNLVYLLRCTTGVNDTGKNWKSFQCSRVNIYKFSFKFTLRCLQSDIVPLFDDTGGNLPLALLPLALLPLALLTLAAKLRPVLLTPVANLPPVSTAQAELVAKFAAGVVDTGGKLATSVIGTGGAPWPAIISVIFRKNSKWPKSYFQGLGGRWFMKKTQNKKSCDTVPLRFIINYDSLNNFHFPFLLRQHLAFRRDIMTDNWTLCIQ